MALKTIHFTETIIGHLYHSIRGWMALIFRQQHNINLTNIKKYLYVPPNLKMFNGFN